MSKTALVLTPKEWLAYQPDRATKGRESTERWDEAWEVARAAAGLLRQRFGATRVVAFGSLTHRAWFTPWSDVDLAAWGISPGAFYRAVAVVAGLSSQFSVDLVAAEDSPPALRQAIEEGIDL